MRIRRRLEGFTLIELLIVVAIIGIIVAISIINFLNAIQRAKQRRTMADERSLGTAVETYAADLIRYPPAAGYVLPGGITLPTTTLGVTRDYLNPTYMQHVPMVDGWNSWFQYSSGTERNDYVVCSPGKDGLTESSPTYGPTTDTNADIIFVDGSFVQFPEGVQH
jgi:general secretion pathway protein G